MNKYIIFCLLFTSNVNASENIINDMLNTYAPQPLVLYVQPNNQFFPSTDVPQVTRGNQNLNEVNFMLPKAGQSEKTNLMNIGNDKNCSCWK